MPQVYPTCVTFTLLWKALALFYYHQNSLLVQVSAFQRTSGFTEIVFDVGCVWCQNLFGEDVVHPLFTLNLDCLGMGSHSKGGEIDLGTSNPHFASFVLLSSSKGCQGRKDQFGCTVSWEGKAVGDSGGQGCSSRGAGASFHAGLSVEGDSTLPPSEKASLRRGQQGCCSVLCLTSHLGIFWGSFWHWCSSNFNSTEDLLSQKFFFVRMDFLVEDNLCCLFFQTHYELSFC